MRVLSTTVVAASLVVGAAPAAFSNSDKCGGGTEVDRKRGNIVLQADVQCPKPDPKPDPLADPRNADGSGREGLGSVSGPVVRLTPEQIRAIERREALRSACALTSVGRGPDGDNLSPICGGLGLPRDVAAGVPADASAAVGVAAPAVSVDEVRESAISRLQLSEPVVEASPCLADAASCRGTVGLPVWLWVGGGNGQLPSDSVSATAGPYSITATAKVSKVKWSLGDGQSTVCSGTGTKYVSDVHGWSSPHCGFENGWKQAGTYTLTASYVWEIRWSGDQAGSATQTLSSTRQVTVGELQSVATSTG